MSSLTQRHLHRISKTLDLGEEVLPPGLSALGPSSFKPTYAREADPLKGQSLPENVVPE